MLNAPYAQIHQIFGYKTGDSHRIDTADEVSRPFVAVFWQLRKDQRRALLLTMAYPAFIQFVEETLDSINPEKNEGRVTVSDPVFFEQFMELVEVVNSRFDIGIGASLRLSGIRYLLAVEKDSSGGKILNLIERKGSQKSSELATVPDYLKPSLAELSWRVITVNEDGEKTARFFTVEPNLLRDIHLIRALYGPQEL